MEYPEVQQWNASHETVDRLIYAHPAGKIHRALMAALCQGHEMAFGIYHLSARTSPTMFTPGFVEPRSALDVCWKRNPVRQW